MDVGDWARTIVGGLIGGGLVTALKWRDEIKDRRRLAFVHFYSLANGFMLPRWVARHDPAETYLASGEAMTALTGARISLLLLHPDYELGEAVYAVHHKVKIMWDLPRHLEGPPYDEAEVGKKLRPALEELGAALNNLFKVGKRLYAPDVGL
jgi:hypothetical protein